MGSIDMMTAMILGLSINAIMAILILITARQFPTIAAQSMRHWSFGLFYLSISYAVYSSLYQEKSLAVNFIGDFGIVLGISFMTYAVSLFLKTNSLKLLQTLTMISMLMILAGNFVIQSPTMTILITIACLTVIVCSQAQPMIKLIIKQPTSAKIILFSINCTFIAVMLFRALEYFVSHKTAWDFNAVSTADFLTILMAVVGPVIATFGFMFMHQEKAYHELTRMASIDSLTRIYNRHAIEIKARALFKEAQKHNQNISVMLIDLDKFKSINDQYGHAAGDQVLIDTAQLIRSLLAAEDLVGRFGGEEFFVLLPNSDLKQARQLAERMLLAIQKHEHSYGKKTFHTTASIGVAQRKINESSFSATLKRADLAMYDAKNNGRNQAIAV
ncbi:GGDEF domain-containing protein [Marinicella sp. S1101]|uniref:GGDEF domain-containing protein n=1 Tax=Marinicella marina TaxID=2996016 RepID=UPI002260B277|nr:GGDEF domain-containing protein [Marinicella marina]MCX7554036.1 GGDEF domain-containing protein [Marinicella marina]MDJ1140528.1 GGDEF domain-containing protein [Marinicella marina]